MSSKLQTEEMEVELEIIVVSLWWEIMLLRYIRMEQFLTKTRTDIVTSELPLWQKKSSFGDQSFCVNGQPVFFSHF